MTPSLLSAYCQLWGRCAAAAIWQPAAEQLRWQKLDMAHSRAGRTKGISSTWWTLGLLSVMKETIETFKLRGYQRDWPWGHCRGGAIRSLESLNAAAFKHCGRRRQLVVLQCITANIHETMTWGVTGEDSAQECFPPGTLAVWHWLQPQSACLRRSDFQVQRFRLSSWRLYSTWMTRARTVCTVRMTVTGTVEPEL